MPLRRHRAPGAAAGLIALLAGCGGADTPTRPPVAVATLTPVPAPTARDGWTDEPVAADITPAQPAMSAAVLARAAGYLPRETLYEGTPLFLWPGDDAYVRELVYGDEPPWDRLQRWNSPIRLTADAELLGNGAVMAKLQEVAAEGRRATGYDIAVAEQGNVEVAIDPNQEGSVAYAEMRYRGFAIVGGRLVFWKLPEITGGHGSEYRNTLLHEFGHALGLGHSIDDDDVMIPGFGRGAKVGAFSERETVVLRLMYKHRRSGNAFPDKAAELVAGSTVTRRRLIVD